VLDEAQHIKNRQTQNAQAVKAVRHPASLVLTGTPLENSVLDLWSNLRFFDAGLFGDSQDFRERYEIPVSRERTLRPRPAGAAVAAVFVATFETRVAADFAGKLEQVTFCDLTREQRAFINSSSRPVERKCWRPSAPKAWPAAAWLS
jgi:SNF2 family DNA or RNA helicase